MSRLGNLFSSQSASDSNEALKYSAPKEPKAKNASKARVDSFSALLESNKSSVPSVTSASPSTPSPLIASAPATASKSSGPSKVLTSASVLLYKVNSFTNAYEPVENGSPLGCVAMGTGVNYQLFIYNAQQQPQCVVALTMAFDYTLRDLYMSFTDGSTGQSWSALFNSTETMANFLRCLNIIVLHLATHANASSSVQSISRSLPVDSNTIDESSAVLEMNGSGTSMAAGIYLKIWEIADLEDYPNDILSAAPSKAIQAPEDVLKVKMISSEETLSGLTESLIGRRRGEKFMIGISPATYFKNNATNGLFPVSERKFPGSWLAIEAEICKIKSDSKEKEKPKKADKSPLNEIDVVSPAMHSGDSSNSYDIASRMARLSQSGGGKQLGDILNSSSSVPTSVISAEIQSAAVVNRQPSPALSQSQSIPETSPPPTTNALTVVEGQGVRSYYSTVPSETSGNTSTSYHNPYMPVSSHTSGSPDPALQQSLVMMQQSMMQLHSKLDQVGAQVSNTFHSLQQQHQMNTYGNPMMMNNSYSLMQGMQGPYSMNGAQNGSLQQQLQLLLQQQQQQLSPQLLQSNGNTGSKENPVRLKGTELIENLQFILEEYERLMNVGLVKRSDSNVTAGQVEEYHSQIKALREAIDKLESKNDALSAKNEKLVDEKSALLEKQSDVMIHSVSSANKLQNLQAQYDLLLQSKQTLQSELDRKCIEFDAKMLQTSVVDSSAIVSYQLKISELENRLVVMTDEQGEMKMRLIAAEQKPTVDLNDISVQNYVQKEVQKALETLRMEHFTEMNTLRLQLKVLDDTKNTAEKLSEESKAAVTSLKEELLQVKGVAAREEAKRIEIESNHKILSDHFVSYQQQYPVCNDSGGKKIDVELLRELMQDIYNKSNDIFAATSTSEESTPNFSSKEVLKGIKMVLKQITNEKLG